MDSSTGQCNCQLCNPGPYGVGASDAFVAQSELLQAEQKLAHKKAERVDAQPFPVTLDDGAAFGA